MLEHGGNLRDAVARYGRPLADWVDLSTGINPDFYPVPALSSNAWHRLPEISDALNAAASAYYQAPALLAVAGSQAAIQALPRLRAASRVVVSAPSYAEHAHQWRQAGHQVSECPFSELAQQLAECDVMVICQPNNPTGAWIAPAELLQWAQRLHQRGGWLIVDEAFGDTLPEISLAAHTEHAQHAGLIVLRSVGKFFGLAGLRLGFVAAAPELLTRLADWLGPWAVSGPAQEVALRALSDLDWQQQTRARLLLQGQRLRELLQAQRLPSSGTDLFQWVSAQDLQGQTETLWEWLAQRGIWTRYFAPGPQRPHGIRFGLPASEAAWQRLELALQEWTKQG